MRICSWEDCVWPGRDESDLPRRCLGTLSAQWLNMVPDTAGDLFIAIIDLPSLLSGVASLKMGFCTLRPIG